MPFRTGDVVLVPFDFANGTGTKWRPAVVVSGDTYNDRSPDVLIASITGNLRAIPHPGDHEIVEWAQAGLLRPSLARTKIVTIEASTIGRRLGRLQPADLEAFDRGLGEALALG
jgi:mRNA-degrading endonuclease toxin of MazEF toxin-antitoxin module